MSDYFSFKWENWIIQCGIQDNWLAKSVYVLILILEMLPYMSRGTHYRCDQVKDPVMERFSWIVWRAQSNYKYLYEER